MLLTNAVGEGRPRPAEVGREYATFMEQSMRQPYFIGWHICGYMMGGSGMATKSSNLIEQYRFLEPDGTPHEVELKQVVAANRNAAK